MVICIGSSKRSSISVSASTDLEFSAALELSMDIPSMSFGEGILSNSKDIFLAYSISISYFVVSSGAIGAGMGGVISLPVYPYKRFRRKVRDCSPAGASDISFEAYLVFAVPVVAVVQVFLKVERRKIRKRNQQRRRQHSKSISEERFFDRPRR